MSDSLYEDVLNKADIVRVIGSYISLTKKGKNFVGVCPFHNDKNPSLFVSPDKKIYKCFSCGHTGNAITFVKDKEKISTESAIKKVAQLIGYDDPRLHERINKIHTDPNLDKLYSCINDLSSTYHFLLKSISQKPAKDYLNNRKIDEEKIEKFQIGFCPDDGTKTIKFLLEKGYTLKDINDIGVLKTIGSENFDLNSGRIIFPLWNGEGKVIGFSARQIIKDDKQPKYVNTGETKLFTKSKVLYNYFRAKESCKHDKFIYLTEGFMDAIALDSIGKSAVALMGTALTKDHIFMLKKLNVEVRLCLDNDEPGRIATRNGIILLKKEKVPFRIVNGQTKYKDSDEILFNEGPAALERYCSSLTNEFDFELDSLSKNISSLSILEKEKKGEEMISYLSSIKDDSLSFNSFLEKFCSIFGYSKNIVLEKLKNAVPNKIFPAEESKQISVQETKKKMNEGKDLAGDETLSSLTFVKRNYPVLYRFELYIVNILLFKKDLVLKHFQNEILLIDELRNAYNFIASNNIQFTKVNEFKDFINKNDVELLEGYKNCLRSNDPKTLKRNIFSVNIDLINGENDKSMECKKEEHKKLLKEFKDKEEDYSNYKTCPTDVVYLRTIVSKNNKGE